MADFDPSELDIFTPTHTNRYNACIGTNSLHDLRTYAEGYLQASQMLLDNIFEKRLAYERDTLVHPILYSARHAIELSIKHVLVRLNETDRKTDNRLLHGHSLKELWDLFKKQTLFDRRFVSVVGDIDSIVVQLDQADPDAQDFRYPVNADGQQTLDGKVIVDLITVKELVDFLKDRVLYLFHLTETVVEERQLHAFTNELNREELRQLSIDLPDVSTWRDGGAFIEVKGQWRHELGLSNRAFSRAVDFIKGHREFAGNIGSEYSFVVLDEAVLDEVLKKAHEVQLERFANRHDHGFERLRKPSPVYAAYESIKGILSPSAVAEIESLFYLSRDGHYSEEFDFLFKHFNKSMTALSGERLVEEMKRSFIHVFEKTNFIDELINGVRKIGKLTLAEKFSKYVVHVEVELDDLGIEMEFK